MCVIYACAGAVAASSFFLYFRMSGKETAQWILDINHNKEVCFTELIIFCRDVKLL